MPSIHCIRQSTTAGSIVRATGQKLVLSPPLVIEAEQVDRLAEIIVSELAATVVPA